MKKLATILTFFACACVSFAGNPPADTLRILALGNSFSADATQNYLYEIGKAAGYEMIIGNLNIGGCSLERHFKNVQSGEKAYGFRLNRCGSVTSKKASILDGIKACKWDIISFQQVSSLAGMAETFEPYLSEIKKFFEANVSGNPKYYWQQTWAYAIDATHGGFKNYGRDQIVMYNAIVGASSKACADHSLTVIPSGTAIQNGRTTVLGQNFVRDGFHMAIPTGRFTVALTWFETFTGLDSRKNPFKPEDLQDIHADICKAAAHAAVVSPWSVTPLPEYGWKAQVSARANYDESKLPPYVLPDPLKMQDGSRVKNRKDWYEKRRPELLELFSEEMFGKAPVEVPEGVSYEVIESAGDAFGGLATRKQVRIKIPDTFSKSKPSHQAITVLIYLPNDRPKDGAPVFLGINFYGNEAVAADPAIKPASGKGIHKAAERGSASSRWEIENTLRRGYGVVTFFRSDVAPDYDTRSEGILRILPGGKPDSWGHIAAWAWGIRRVMDYLETDQDVNSSRVAVMGHSRMGKTALWAGATDPRIAMVIANDSGCCGAALSKRRFGETIRTLNVVRPYWFCHNFRKYSDNEDALPFDQHELLALIAPRPLYVASSSEDLNADPKGEKMALDEASKVYRFLGAKEKTGYHCKSGRHSITVEDWNHFLDFADKWLK